MILNYTDTNKDGTQTVLLLHGMACSTQYWKSVIAASSVKFRFISIDLLGFGHSPKPHDATYDYETHIECIIATLKKENVVFPVIIVGHSMGSLIGLRLTSLHPGLVCKLILCGLPYYPSKYIARREIVNNKKIWELIYYGPTSRALCFLWCTLLRPITKYLTPIYLPYLPKPVAEDTLLHTWQAYSQSLRYIIEEQDIRADIIKLQIPAILLYGSSDKSLKYIKEEKISELKNVRLCIYPGLTHQLPLEKPKLIADVLA